MAFSPDNKRYLPMSWDGVVTANDLAIQNQPWSLGQHEGPTEAQRAQQEREQWFRDRGLDPNQYYGEQIEAQAAQPGFNPAGGKVNQGKPLKQQTIWSDGRTTGYDASTDKSKFPLIDPKAAAARAEEWRAQQRAVGAPGTTAPTVTTANWWQDNNYHPVIGNTAPAAPSAPTGGLVVPQTQEIFDGPQNPLLPNYQTGGMTALQPMAQIGQPTRSVLPQLQQQQGLATPGSAPIGTPAQSFGNAAKLLQLPSYLRRGIGVGGIRRTY